MNKYLVTYEIERKICEPVIETATQIFNRMAMDDCYDIHVLDLKLLQKPENRADIYYPACSFHGKWCCKNPETGKIDSLRMEIRKKFLDTDIIYDVGYAPDH